MTGKEQILKQVDDLRILINKKTGVFAKCKDSISALSFQLCHADPSWPEVIQLKQLLGLESSAPNDEIIEKVRSLS